MTVHEKMTAIADAIRAKTGESSDVKYGLDAMAQAIAALETGVELPDFVTEIDFGTFTSSSYSSQYTIPHNLSDRPKCYFLWKAVDGEKGNYAVRFAGGYRGNIAYSSTSSYTAMLFTEQSGSMGNVVTTTGKDGGSYMDQNSFLVSAVLTPGDVYNWIAWR